MATPIAYFTFTSNGLTLTFKDKSINTPTSWAWDFGFEGGVSSLQNPPDIVFPSENVYTIKLIATNTDGSNTFSFDIRVSVTPVVGLTIDEMVMGELPSGIIINQNFYNSIIKKWQIYFQSAAGIADADVFNEGKWPPLYNILIARLAIYDFILIGSRNLITHSLTSGLITADSLAGSLSFSGKGTVQKIETGPSNVEWYDPFAQWANLLKSGLLNNTQQEICMLALQLHVRLYFCPWPKSTQIFIVGKKHYKKC